LKTNIFNNVLCLSRTIGLRAIAAAFALFALMANPAQAATYYWDTTTTNTWTTGANWSNNATSGGTTGTAPGAGDAVVFNQSSVNGAETVNLGAAVSITSITFANTGTTLLEGGGSNETLTLGNNSGNGAITVNSGAGAVTIGSSTSGQNVTLDISGNGTINNNSSNVLTIDNGVTNPGTADTLVVGGSGSGGTTFNGAVTNGGSGILNVNVQTTGTGTTTLASSSNSFNNLNVQGGIASVTGATALSGYINASGGVLNISANVTTTGGSTGGILIGNGTAGAIYQTAGTVTDTATGNPIGDGGSAYYNLSGGNLNVGDWNMGGLTTAGPAVMDVSNGTMTDTSFFDLGRGPGSSSVVNLTGGTINADTSNTGAWISFDYQNGSGLGSTVSTSGTAVLNVINGNFNGPSDTSYGYITLNNSSNAGNLSVLNLGGGLGTGTVTINGINAGYSSATGGYSFINFNGGTLKATAINYGGSFLNNSNITGVYVYGNGGTINNNGTSITIGNALLAPTGSGLTTGTLTPTSGGAGYIGAPLVTISGGGGVGATAYAIVSGGVVTGIVITNPGTGYTSAPTFTFTGGGDTSAASYTATTGNLSTNTSGGMTFNGTGTTTLSGANTYSGGTTVNQGTVTVSGSGATLGATTGTLAVNNTNTGAGTATVLNLSTSAATTTGSLSGTVSQTGVTSGTNTATINNGGKLFTVNQTSAGAYGGIIAGTGGFTLGSSSTNTLTLSNTNTYSGATTVSAGNLVLTGSLASGSAVTVGNNNSTMAILSGTGKVNGSLTTATTGSNVAYIAPGVNISGTRTDFGAVGTLQVGSLGFTVGTGTQFDYDLNTSTAAGGTSNDLVAMSGGTLTLGSSIVFNFNALSSLTTGTAYTLIDGATTISGFSAGNFSAMNIGSDTATFSTSGGDLLVTFSGGGATNGMYTLTTTPASLNVHAGGGTTTLATVIANTGTLTQDALNYSGVAATASSGTVGTATGTTSGSNLAQGQNNSPGASQTFTAGSAGNVTIGNSATVSNVTASGTPSGTTVGATINVYSGLSTWTGAGASGVWGTGPSDANFGVNWGTNQGSPGVTSGFTGLDTATFGNVSGHTAVQVNLSGANPNLNSITFNTPSPSATSYTIGGGSDTGTITLSGTTPNITVTAGTHTIGAPIVLGANTALAVSSGQQLTVSGQISGSSYGLSNTGAGTTILNNAAGNTYGGGTTISAGKFYVNNTSNSGTGTGSVTVQSGGTLAGSGTISGAVTVQSGGTLASGAAQTNVVSPTNPGGVDTVTGAGLTADLAVNGGATLTFDLGAGASTGYLNYASPNLNSTYLTSTGTVTFGATGGPVDITLVDLTAFSTTDTLQLRYQNPYLLIAAGGLDSNYDLVTTGGYDQNGVVLGIGSSGTGNTILNTFSLSAQDINGGALTDPYNNLQLYLYNGDLEVVPEPGTWALMLGGLALLVFIQRRKNSKY
jgi:hypothetical protein